MSDSGLAGLAMSVNLNANVSKPEYDIRLLSTKPGEVSHQACVITRGRSWVRFSNVI